ncbi:unnamed protein product [Bemisia tabaci]|uniref:Eukaryotic translation initiation factor 3 subunit A n=1 Tax=Bemisia tabaci TaxID=7038 RepID=A0A9P0F6C4_BEMTA|nr:PREDICTED: eukaryotic translation initiation factor 3 subunit A [Bemisia tabaci]CAH0394207.1 unnamed protein product [Bemisia tabaci]
MARMFQRPENALKRANEFIEVGKKDQALVTLYEVFKNKKFTYSFSESVLEPIMFKYLDLCVELKKSHIAKEGLFQYRNVFQTVNVGSLENVIRGYLKSAEERTEAARELSQQAVVDIDDLDNITTPESILLSAVSGEDAQDRSERTHLAPWVKFLWESYGQCLELLKINVHVEPLYHDIARMAFSFCLNYGRKAEFRKLCEKLRKHLEDIGKSSPTNLSNVNLTRPDTQQFNLDTRLIQLDYAAQMELWQEAFKITEDIHNLMMISKKLPNPKTMANYYQKLAMVFWKAGYYLFHAAALFKLFQLSKEMKKNLTPEELQRMACRVLLAVLAIPLPSSHPEFCRFIETEKSPLEKAQRLATLLSLPQAPTRISLIKDIVRANIVSLASQPLQELYELLEVEFSPLDLCSRVHHITSTLTEDSQYIAPLHEVTLVRLIKQVSQVYQTVKFTRLIELSHFGSPFQLERLLVDCVRHNDMQVIIDHRAGCVHFGKDLSDSREDKPDGPTLQSMPSDQIRSQLISMSQVLTSAIQIINPDVLQASREERHEKLVKYYLANARKEHLSILNRHKIIEERKMYVEKMNLQREEADQRKAEERNRRLALAEKERLEKEQKERERKRKENEMRQQQDQILKDKMAAISQKSYGQKMLKKLDEEDLSKLDPDKIAMREQEELIKERKDFQQRLKTQEKKVDYYERAKRVEEIPLLQKAIEEKKIEHRDYWEQKEKERIKALTEERKFFVEQHERLGRMAADKEAFLASLRSKRYAAFQEQLKEYEKRLEEERKKRLQERKEQRKKERMELYEKRMIEEEKRRQEEEEAKRKEEELRKKREEEKLAAKLKAEKDEEYRKRKEALDKKAELQRQREEEAERKREELLKQAEMDRMRRPGDGPRQDPPPKQVYRPPQRKTGPPEPARPEPRENRPEPPAPGKENKDVKISSEKWVPSFRRGKTEGASNGGPRN